MLNISLGETNSEDVIYILKIRSVLCRDYVLFFIYLNIRIYTVEGVFAWRKRAINERFIII